MAPYNVLYEIMKFMVQISNLLQVGAIAPQSLEPLLQSIHECLSSTDWATRKAAAETLSALALHSSNMITEVAASTLTVLEGCRFDKVPFCSYFLKKIIFFWWGWGWGPGAKLCLCICPTALE